MRRFLKISNLVLFVILLSSHAQAALLSEDNKPILQYIHASWHDLTRTATNCGTYKDIKVANSPFLYVPKQFPINDTIRNLETSCHINVATLPRVIHNVGDVKTNELLAAGLLYLPYPYVVPGGRFNEMYGWDSYFIILGLLHDGENQLANNMLENYFFEIKYYGTILNANRTYHLSRSQPPFLSSAILAVYHTQQADKKAWLQRAYNIAKKDYAQWIKPPFLAGNTGLSRYYDVENESLVEEKVFPNYYQRVLSYIEKHPDISSFYLDKNNKKLSGDFYQGERSLRASGFDITSRFGTFGGETHHFAPVCLNSLLYKTEIDLKHIADILGKKTDAKMWLARAKKRQRAVMKYLWNEKNGLFLDYDFTKNKQSNYHYATTFYPLWAGIATPHQALAVEKNLKLFEQPGGLAMSDIETGLQWDKPFGWAPIQLLAVQGLLKYGYHHDATRLAHHFYQTVANDFNTTHKIYEKYNVIKQSSEFSTRIGYVENVVGFGWTNSTVLLFDDLLKKPA